MSISFLPFIGISKFHLIKFLFLASVRGVGYTVFTEALLTKDYFLITDYQRTSNELRFIFLKNIISYETKYKFIVINYKIDNNPELKFIIFETQNKEKWITEFEKLGIKEQKFFNYGNLEILMKYYLPLQIFVMITLQISFIILAFAIANNKR